MAFWRIEYEGSFDKELMLERGQLAWPRTISLADRKKFGKQMRLGDGIVWGKLRGTKGMIDGIGRITGKQAHDVKGFEVNVEWQELPPFYVTPETTGRSKWKKHPVFKFAADPTERYKLEKLLVEHLGDGED